MLHDDLATLRAWLEPYDLHTDSSHTHEELFGWSLRDISALDAAIRALCDRAAPLWESVSIDVHVDQHIYTEQSTHTATPEQVTALRRGVRGFYTSLPSAWRGFDPDAKGWSHSLEVTIPLRRVQPHEGWPVIDALELHVLLYDVDLELDPGAGPPSEAILYIGTPSPDTSLGEDDWLSLLEYVKLSKLWREVVDDRYTRPVQRWLDVLQAYHEHGVQ